MQYTANSTGCKDKPGNAARQQNNFVDENTNIARQNLSNINPGVTNISLDITSNQNVQSAKALFARIGVKANGAAQAVYSEIFRLK